MAESVDRRRNGSRNASARQIHQPHDDAQSAAPDDVDVVGADVELIADNVTSSSDESRSPPVGRRRCVACPELALDQLELRAAALIVELSSASRAGG
jgi:hypothetical protein